MHKPQQQVRDFQRAAGQPAPEDPIIDWYEANNRCIDLIREEVEELIMAIHLMQQKQMIQEACDLLYVVYGLFVTMGIDAEPYFDEVHRANIQKMGGPKREDGKQLKPDNWIPPDMEFVSRRRYSHSRLEEVPPDAYAPD